MIPSSRRARNLFCRPYLDLEQNRSINQNMNISEDDRRTVKFSRFSEPKFRITDVSADFHLRTFALIVCAQPFCAGNATVICHASLRLTGPEDKHGVENAGEKNSGRVYSFRSSVTPIFFNHESLTLLTIYKI